MDRKPLEGLIIFLTWVVAYFVIAQIGQHKRNPRIDSDEPYVIRSTRLPFRFSLRALLIATTLVAVILGLFVWGAR